MRLCRKRLTLFVIIVLIYLKFSLWLLAYSEAIISPLTVIILTAFQLISRKKIILNYSYSMMAFVLCSIAGLSCIVNMSFGVLNLYVFIQWIIAILLVSTFTLEEMSRAYVKAIYIISAFSLVGFSAVVFIPSLVEKFPYITTTKWIGDSVSQNIRNMFVCVGVIGVNYKRNWGIFYEPGMFAFQLNMAIFMMLFINRDIRIKELIVLTIAQLTTTSTNGYATLVLLYFTYFTQKKSVRTVNGRISPKYDRMLRNGILTFAIVALIGVCVFFIKNPSRWRFFISKLSEATGNLGSGYERFRALKIAMTCIIRNPILGVSPDRIRLFSNGAITTFTPLQWMANFGVIYGLFCNMFFCLFGYEKNDRRMNKIFKSLTLFTMIVSQNMTSNCIVLAIILYTSGRYIQFNRNGRRYVVSNCADLQHRKIPKKMSL